ncbi:MAG: hypothetical protein HRT71_00895 [Flavobacteriales bacterium]|nr:hypothetical protein [Flavobacteriales bacterium]
MKKIKQNITSLSFLRNAGNKLVILSLLACSFNLSAFSQDEPHPEDESDPNVEYYRLFLSKTMDKGQNKRNVFYFQTHISSERFIRNLAIEFGDPKSSPKGDFEVNSKHIWSKVKYLEWSDKNLVLEMNDDFCNGLDHCVTFSFYEAKGNDLLDPSHEDYKDIFDHFQQKIGRSYFRSVVFF